jgi:hypothetical protein
LRLLFGSAHLLDRLGEDLDGMELVEGDGGLGRVVGDALDELATGREVLGERCDVLASRTSAANSTRASSRSTNSEI